MSFLINHHHHHHHRHRVAPDGKSRFHVASTHSPAVLVVLLNVVVVLDDVTASVTATAAAPGSIITVHFIAVALCAPGAIHALRRGEAELHNEWKLGTWGRVQSW